MGSDYQSSNEDEPKGFQKEDLEDSWDKSSEESSDEEYGSVAEQSELQNFERDEHTTEKKQDDE